MEERLEELVADIKAHGLRKRIEVWREPSGLRRQFIIDGRNRLEACKRAGINPSFRDVTTDVDDPIAYVASVNLKRRDLTPAQRAAIIAELATLPVGANQHRKEPVPGGTPTLEKAAKLAGVSRRSVARAKALKKAAPEAFAKVKAGKVPLNTACEAVKAVTTTAVALPAKPVDEFGSFIPLIRPDPDAVEAATKRKPAKTPIARPLSVLPDTPFLWCKQQLLAMPMEERISAFLRLMTDCEITAADLASALAASAPRVSEAARR